MNRLFTASGPFELSPARKLFSYTILIIWAIIVLFPFYWLIVTAFKLPIDVNTGPKYIPFVDFHPSLHAYHELFTDPSAGNLVTRPYTNTFIVAIVSSMIVLFVGSFAAYALTRFEYHPKPGLIGSFIGCGALTGLLIISLGVAWYWAVLIGLVLFGIIAQTIGRKFKGAMNNDDVAFWLISQRMLPPVAVILPIYMMFSKLGLLDTLFAIIVVYIASHLPLVIWFMRDYIMTIPLELEESAFIDGASRFVVMYKVILPLAVPGLVATFLIVLIFAWNEYILALFLSTANAQTMPVLVAAQNATRGPQWWNISMLVMMMVAPIIIMAFFLERFIAKGILMGAVKG